MTGDTGTAKWLVKSSGRVLGPCTMDEVIEHIRQRNFSVLDEIREPQSRWTFLREHPQLAQIVRQVRDEHANIMENTQSTFVTGGRTVTSSVTERILEEQTPTPNPGPVDGMKSVTGTEKNVATAVGGSKSFGVLSDQKVQTQLAKQNSQWKYLVYGLAVVALVGAGVYFQNQTGPKLSGEKANEMIRNANDLAAYGEYDLALKNVQEVEVLRGLTAADKLLKLKLLFVREESSPLDMNRTYEELATLGQQQVPVSLDLLQGLVFDRLAKVKDAQAAFKRALDKNRNSEEAVLNLAASHLLAGEVSKAWMYLSNASIQENKPYFQVLKSLVALHWEDPKSQREIQTRAFEEFKNFDRVGASSGSDASFRNFEQLKLADFGRDLRFERLMFLALLAQRIGRLDEVSRIQEKMVQMNPMDQANYLKSPLLDWQVLGWNRLRGYCETLRKAQADSGKIRSIWAMCLVSSGDLVGARGHIEAANKQFRGDTSVAGVDALLLWSAGRQSEAERVVQLYPMSDRVLIHWVRGVICEGEAKRDSACAERAWTQVKNIDPTEPRAYFGLATAAAAMMNDSKRRENSSQGIKFAGNYIPLLRVSNVKSTF